MKSLREIVAQYWAGFCVWLGYPPSDGEAGLEAELRAEPMTSEWPPDPSLYLAEREAEPPRKPWRLEPEPSFVEAPTVEPALIPGEGLPAPPETETGSAIAQERLPFPREADEPTAQPIEPPPVTWVEPVEAATPLEVELEPAPIVEPEPAAIPMEDVEPELPAIETPPAEAEPEVAPRFRGGVRETYRYEVTEGDTLSSIAKRFGVTVHALVDANDLPDPNRIYAGQKLSIPGYHPPAPPPEPKPAATVGIEPGLHLRYKVQPGDTLGAIAKRFGVTVRGLVEANDIDDPHLIQPGQLLVIPGVSVPVARPEPTAEPAPARTALEPEELHGFYVSYHAIGSPAFREHIDHLLATTALNATVIDVKSDYGWITHPTNVALAVEIGANQPSAPDLAEVLADLKTRGVYTIARLVVFKDDLMARAQPEYAVKVAGNGRLWRDRQNQRWIDPFRPEVWEYNLQVAEEVTRLGFAEIQFDYARFPLLGAARPPQFSQEATPESRLRAITGFLSEAQGRLTPLGVGVTASVFGYACWRQDDTLIGQNVERMAPYLDVLSPLLYPSTFSSGIPNCKQAIECPYEIVYQSARRAVERVAATGCRVRPWLQDFPDYRFDRRVYGTEEIQAQIRGALDAGCAGYMMFDPRVKYSAAAYR